MTTPLFDALRTCLRKAEPPARRPLALHRTVWSGSPVGE